MKKYVVPIIGRAGLGNELFPVLRAASISKQEARSLLWPTWFQLRIGPLLRGEADKRFYWRLFRTPGLSTVFRRTRAKIYTRGAHRPHRGSQYVTTEGMQGYFSDSALSGPEFRELLVGQARSGVISASVLRPYIALHVRLGDFARGSDTAAALSRNNTSSPMIWFVARLHAARSARPDLEFYVCSDGSDDELADILVLPGVSRGPGRNALDDLVFMSHAVGIIGSRSTFSAWGAFLGAVPLLVQSGGNAYAPHEEVWEVDAEENAAAWDLAVETSRSRRATR